LLSVMGIGFIPTAQAAAPFIFNLNPTSANVGDPGVTISISGVNFQPGALTFWNNTLVSSSLVGNSLIVANIPGSLLSPAGVATITVGNPDGSRSNGLSFVVNQPALSITTSTLPNAVTGTAYTAALTANGGTAPYAWSVVDALPRGLTLSP